MPAGHPRTLHTPPDSSAPENLRFLCGPQFFGLGVDIRPQWRWGASMDSPRTYAHFSDICSAGWGPSKFVIFHKVPLPQQFRRDSSGLRWNWNPFMRRFVEFGFATNRWNWLSFKCGILFVSPCWKLSSFIVFQSPGVWRYNISFTQNIRVPYLVCAR